MNELADLCGGGVGAATLDQLRERCDRFGAAIGVSPIEAVTMGMLALFAFMLVAGTRQQSGASGGAVVGNAFEAAVYAAIGFFAGSGFGLFAAEIVPPFWFGLIFLGHCLFALVWVLMGVFGEDADGDGKVIAVILGVVLVGLGGLVFALALAVPDDAAAGSYETYLNVVAIVVGLLGAIDGIVAALTRAAHWAFGWALVALNSSWGFLGNVLGLGSHIASYFCFGGNSLPRGGALEPNRSAFTLYKRGLTLKRVYRTDAAGNVQRDPATGKPLISQRFAFTQGWVVSCEHGGDVERHEAIHVAQHFVLGPIYFLSHAAWDVLGAIIGLFAAIKHGLNTAMTNVVYYNNPYEIVAYASHTGARDDPGPMIMRGPWSGIFAVTWIVLSVVGFGILIFVVWH